MSDSYNFDKVYKEYHSKVLRYLSRMVGPGEAEDLTQEVFIKINNALPDFKGKSSISTWIYRIASNTAVDRLRNPSFKEARENIPEEALIAEDQSPWEEKKILSFDQQLIEAEMNDCIRSYINTLPENYRTVLVLSELEILKNREISEILGISLETVKIRLHRARGRLKKILDGRCDFYYNTENQLA